VALGPLAGLAWEALLDIPENERPAVWAVCEFDFIDIPKKFINQIMNGALYVVEEHVCQGGLGTQLAYELFKRTITVSNFVHRFALGYPTGRYGSQAFHRSQCGLDSSSLHSMIRESLK
jgi:transketolase